MKKILLSLFVCSSMITGLFAQAPVTDFSGTPRTICAGQAVTWTNLTTGGTTYAWSFPGATNATSTAQAPGPRTYTASGTYTVTLIATNTSGSDTMIKADYITVLAAPATTVYPASGSICTLGSVTLTASGGDSYLWSPATGLDNTTGSVVIATPATSTTYTVTGTNTNGCTKNTTVAVTVSTGPPPAPVSMTGPTTVCNGQTGVVFTVPNINPAPVRTWTVPAGATITAGLGTRSITVSFGATSGDVCCVASNVCGSSAPFCKTITVNPTPQVGTVGTITGPTNLCGIQTGVNYSINPVANATTYTWTTTGTATVTAGQGTTSVTIGFGTGNSNVCVSAGNDCNTSAQVCRTVSVVAGIPAVPGNITGLTTVCTGQSGVGYSVATVATTSYYQWTIVPSDASITAGQGTRSVTITFGSSSGTVCVSDSNSCGKSAVNCQAITVDPNPAVGTIGTLTGPTTICGNQSATYSIDPVSGASTYSWTIPAGATITAGQGTSTISVTYSVTGGNVCVTASNNCSKSAQKCLNVSLTNIPATPGAITGPTVVCNGQTGVVYTVPNTGGNNAPVRTWTVPAGATILTGQGTRSVTISFGTATSGTICCTASNTCGASASSCLTVTVDPNSAVGTVGTIAGPPALCATQSAVPYFITPVTGATTYTWTVPAGAAITSGQGTENILVTYAAASGSVCVTAGNSCGKSQQKCLKVAISTSVAATPGAITGLTTVCSEQAGSYSIAPVPNATSYAWTVPAGATITSGQGTVNTQVTFGNTAGSICVAAGNICGTSAPSCTTMVVDAAVLTVNTTVTNTSDGSICDGSAAAIPGGAAGPYTYAWTPSGVSSAVATGLCYGSHTVCVTSAGGCITCTQVYVASPAGIADLTDNGTIKVFPNPANDYIVIEGILSSSANLHISVVNMMGKRMIEESVFADRNFSQKINIQGIPSGVYFIEVRSGEMVRNSKMIKIH